jgi:hypothetical protein
MVFTVLSDPIKLGVAAEAAQAITAINIATAAHRVVGREAWRGLNISTPFVNAQVTTQQV